MSKRSTESINKNISCIKNYQGNTFYINPSHQIEQIMKSIIAQLVSV